MRAPSINVLQQTLRLDLEQAKLVRAFAKAADDADDLRSLVDARAPETARYVRSMYNDPYRSSMWRTTVALHAIDEVVGGYGVEGLGPDVGGPTPPPYEYINAGDTYATTLIYRRRTDTLSVGSWGDIVERHPTWSGESDGLGAASVKGVKGIAVPDTVRAWQLFDDAPGAKTAAAELAAAALAAAQELENDLQGIDGDSGKHQRFAAKAIAGVYTEMLKPVMAKWRNVGANDTEPRYVGQQFLIDVAKQIMGIPLNEWTRLGEEL